MSLSKKLADLFTALRALVASTLAGLGLFADQSSLETSVYLMLVSWTSDYFDGMLARRSTPSRHTWLGDHDLMIDMAAAFGLLVYLTGVGFLSPTFSLTYLVVWLFIFWRYGISKPTGSLFQAPVYGLLLWLASTRAPQAAIWALVWIPLAVLLSWRRFLFQIIPEFLHGIVKVFGRRAH